MMSLYLTRDGSSLTVFVVVMIELSRKLGSGNDSRRQRF